MTDLVQKGRGRYAITPVMRYHCGWLCRRQHRRSKVLLHIAHYYCWHEWWRGSLQTRWRTSRCLLAGLCTPAFSSGSDALGSSQVEPRLCLHDFVLLLWNLLPWCAVWKSTGRRGREHTHLVQLKRTDTVESVGLHPKSPLYSLSSALTRI